MCTAALTEAALVVALLAAAVRLEGAAALLAAAARVAVFRIMLK